ncbi:hypothetical protein CsSME_00013095 [Camellia sinensis var. sinensis]
MCSGGGGGYERNLGKKNGLWCCSEVDEKGAETASGDRSCWGGVVVLGLQGLHKRNEDTKA